MAVNLSPVGGVAGQFFDNNGNPLSGGKVFTYSAGTTTPAITYTSSTGTTPHTNPIILDAAGRVSSGEIWLTDGFQYKFVIKTSTDVQIGSYDNVIGINSNFVNYTSSQEIQTATAGQTVFTLTTMQYQPGTNSLSVFVDGVNQYGPGAMYAYQETSSTVVTFTTGLHVGAKVKFVTSTINSSSYGDAEQISYNPPFVGGAVTNVEARLAQTISVKDFGAVGNGTADDTAAVQAALLAATGKTLYFPAGTYLVTSTLTVGSGTLLVGDGKTASALKLQSTTTGTSLLKNTTPASFNISNMQLQSAGNRNDGYALNGIEIVGTAIFQINDLVVNGFSGKGIFIKNIVDAKINNCVVTNCGTGVFCGPNGPAPSVVFHIRGCYISGCVNYGLYNNSTATLVEACIMELNGVSGTDAAVYSACNRGVYVNTYFESNYRNWVRQDDATIWVSTIPVNSNQPSTISWSSGSPPNERGYADLTYSELAIRNIKPDKFWGSVTFGDNLTAINGQSVRFGKNATKTITVGALAAPNTFETIYTFPASGNYGAITGSGQFRSAYLVYVTIGASDLTQESILCSICNNTLTQIGSSSSNIQLSGNNLQVRSASGTDYGRAVYATINQINTFDDFAGI